MRQKTLEHALKILETKIPFQDFKQKNISKSAVGWHIDHSLKVINKVVIALQNSEPSLYKTNFTILGKILFKLGYFPRGKAKAPKYVKPPKVILKEDLMNQLKLANTNINTLATLPKNAYFKHPLFGDINTPNINRFLLLHTNHHLKIIADILKKENL